MATWNSRGLRGSTLEEFINRTNEKYLENGLALIQKVPTPITPINIDKETRHITLAYFDQKSTVDYIGAVQGIPVCFDAKECHTNTFPLANIHEHQVKFMEQFEKQEGIAFILIENWNKKRKVRVESLNDITYQTAFFIGLFQVLAIIPGTSRSGATIIGALLIGVSRVAAAEFTFFLAVPVMFGWSLIKLIKFGFAFSPQELCALGLGCVVAFAVSVVVIRFLMGYIKKHDFKVFGWYRIILGAIVLGYFAL